MGNTCFTFSIVPHFSALFSNVLQHWSFSNALTQILLFEKPFSTANALKPKHFPSQTSLRAFKRQCECRREKIYPTNMREHTSDTWVVIYHITVEKNVLVSIGHELGKAAAGEKRKNRAKMLSRRESKKNTESKSDGKVFRIFGITQD